MRIITTTATRNTQLLCVFVQGAEKISGLGKLDAGTAAAVRQARDDMGSCLGAVGIVHGGRQARRILLAGLGKKSEMTGDTVRFVSGVVAKKAAELNLQEFTVVVPLGGVQDPAVSASQIVEGAKMSLYKFERFKKEKKNIPDVMTLVIKSKSAIPAVKTAEVISDGAIFAKEVANMPPNECAPATLAEIAKKIKNPRLKCRVIGRDELKRRGFGGITAVGGGSRNDPKLIILEYFGGAKSQRPTVLVGKAVTFDTGGISIKPRERMEEMKFDKCGGCTVLGIIKAVAGLNLKTNIVGIIPSVENMPGGGAYRPGDIIRLYSGKTAEILNTDAEGRLILADALAYGEERYSPKAIIDFATLTGACIVALGTNVAGMVSNDDRLAARISESSARTTEEVWRLPLNEDYMGMIKSDVADMKNMGIGAAAGTISAAAFLRNAMRDTPWAHIDIAGVAWTQASTKKKPYNPKGATGFGVRLILDYLQS
ncbi:MAG: leucyl aminopeptidase [Nitrosopumilus sp. B06]|nr:MAG: leucyl aminopeptidase [Nitrosopumilus sp. D6]RNJ78384.1 MAG: leucyl aminopeptidase [Nitrosopumilus sp. B06]